VPAEEADAVTTKLLVVTRCSACPFFEDSPLKSGLGILGKTLLADEQRGICCLLPSGEFLPTTDIKIGLPPGPARDAEEPRYARAQARRIIEDKRTIPTDCQLQEIDRTITIREGN
jgi:hypothetical protein